jgi:ribosome assembly protein YihI (activator of Der GTPase)
MARVNITIPDEMHRRAKEAGLNVSQLAQQAVAQELANLDKIAGIDQYLAELEAQYGPISEEEQARAAAWADRIYGRAPNRRSA